ncbi:melibiose:sodium transporter MelB [Glaciecola sp. SC05]|uniref:melibiose:sodium transporter MelB n=1 Tax=Glaciecola sp. SC05 TaxID=1987355 RepID=UPI0035292B2E
MINNAEITLKTKVSYGMGALGKDLACSIVYVYLMFYYTDVAGLSAAFVGTLFLVARIADAVTDPMMGMVVDNTRSRFGKFRPWIVIGTVVNSLFLIAVFSTHMLSGTALYVYAAVTYILWGVTYTVMDIPFWSIIPALSKERPERERLVVWPRIFASFAWMVMGAYGLWAIGILGDGDQQKGFFYFAIAIVACFSIGSLITVLNVKEKVTTAVDQNKLSFADIKTIVASNDQLKAFIGVMLTFNISHQLVGGFAIYYFSYAIGDPSLFPMFMLVSGLAEMVGVFVFPYLCRHLPRSSMWLIACAFPVLCCFVLFVTGIISPQSALLVGVSGVLLKFGVGIANGLSIVMLADIVDYGEVKTGFRSESIIFSVIAMLVKFAGAFSGFIIGMGLTLSGYVPNEVQSASTVFGLKIVMLLIPVLFVLASVLIYLKFYKLNGDYYHTVLGPNAQKTPNIA